MNTREAVLAVATMGVGLCALAGWMGSSRLQVWKELYRTHDGLKTRLNVAERIAERRGATQAQLEALLQQLPRHPAEKDVTAEILKTVETLAAQHGLGLTRREPEREKQAGELFEVAINCNWEGALDALVHFLYAVQTQGAILDIRQLTISPARSGGGGLSGSFTVACAYTRGKTPSGAAPVPALASVPSPAATAPAATSANTVTGSVNALTGTVSAATDTVSAAAVTGTAVAATAPAPAAPAPETPATVGVPATTAAPPPGVEGPKPN